MSGVYLFQIDCATNNNDFFERMRSSPSLFYRRAGFQVGKDSWIPDGVRVELHSQAADICLTLIELEETESVGRLSSRKYLPEDPNAILKSFVEYLQREIERCRKGADPREKGLVQLKEALSGGRVTVKTAWALRSSDRIQEELPLLKGAWFQKPPEDPAGQAKKGEGKLDFLRWPAEFRGICRVSPESAKVLRRCVYIVDAVIRHKDDSSARFHSWLMKAPLKDWLKKNPKAPYPYLKKLLETGNSGLKLDCEFLFGELVEIWQSESKINRAEDARNLIEAYFPRCQKIRSHDNMQEIFETARRELESQPALRPMA